MTNIIATTRVWSEHLAIELTKKTGDNFILINNKEDLTLEKLKSIQPDFVFFPHWSYIIPSEIHENFECIIFHMTDVPFGRGGSPLQNLIVRQIYETKISAIRCVKEVDGGEVYLKRPLSLYGTAEEIYIRATKIIEDMIVDIMVNKREPIPQSGEIVSFKRRKPEEGNIEELNQLDRVFDYIRMLDADGYPKAYLETKYFKLEFQRASLKNDRLIADVVFIKKR